ncbi:uncharacterized protein BT62DRAFT_928318 [Guyanagaster necrorhizus]|uniref:Rho GTPase-activating protein 39 n=1 Tax=Guyanagaster necrorhizus TaxID=856835 RepID=A0A9P7VZ35_9AGAR|nr:uncharacterized protein BT62DRAFT_928318 [Guyanagaster necrorhizus MCA 3950]KAG7449597.1 hypothetical protein BT62DRAFT_928318 [Guyanagaster necrorhizus MCA 3950]
MSVMAGSHAPAMPTISLESFPRRAPSSSLPSAVISRQASTSSAKGKASERANGATTPQSPTFKSTRQSRSSTPAQDGEDTTWGSNFWVTLVDPQTQSSFYACPATGQVSWDAPVGNFVLPPSAEGEWWELSDESRGGLSYYYQTKTGETVWERPPGFVIPLGIIQNSALGRRLSHRLSKSMAYDSALQSQRLSPEKPTYRRSNSYANVQDDIPTRKSSHSVTSGKTSAVAKTKSSPARRSFSNDQYHNTNTLNGSNRLHTLAQHLPPIPASPYTSEASLSSPKLKTLTPSSSSPKLKDDALRRSSNNSTPESSVRARSKSSSYVSHRPQLPQSLTAAVEMLSSTSESSHTSNQLSSQTGTSSVQASPTTLDISAAEQSGKRGAPSRPIPPPPGDLKTGRSPPVRINGKEISAPVLNTVATLEMSPVKNRATRKPILIQPRVVSFEAPTATLSSGKSYPVLPHDLASDILQFAESDYAKQYFSTHRTGFIFRRRIPVAQMMSWQKAPLASPLLALNRTLSRDAVKVFKIIQHIMGDREGKPMGVRVHSDGLSTVSSSNTSSASLASNAASILEEERWILSEGLSHGELRDEIYCQLMKQLSGNPNTESVFKGWQLMCVLLITFPPSKNIETYVRGFMQQHLSKQEGRVDIMAKYCLRRLSFISRKGPRSKPPSTAEIEIASDAAFNPSTFGESLDAIIRLQERNYPHQKVPIILPFLADGILALGGTKSEGIFRVPGDGDAVSELKLRIDRGYYTLDGVDDPHVLASLMKSWLRELCDPLVPEEMYNECISSSKDPEACIHIVERLPTINRRVVLFVISFLQLFLDDRTQSLTKMTPANLALVMAPNLLRCNSDSMSIVYTNTQYEQIFVYNLLLYLKCGEVDMDYIPAHGLGAVPAVSRSRSSKSRTRRNRY